MRRLIVGAMVVVFAGLLGIAEAQETANPTGTWKWQSAGRRGGQPREQTLKLKLEGDKLTGALVGRNDQEFAITEATFKDGTISFKVTRQGRGGQERTIAYTGKLEGDTIKGKITRERQGETIETDWEAKRDTGEQA